MSLGLLGAILFAALLHASWNILVKGGENKLFETGLTAAGAFCAALLFLPWLTVPSSLNVCAFLAGSTLCHCTYYLLLAKAYEQSNFTFAYTLMRGIAPLITAFLLQIFGLPLTGSALFAIILLSGGILLLALECIHREATWQGFFTALRTSLCIVGYTLADGLGAQAHGDALSYACFVFILQMIAITFYLLLRFAKSYRTYAQKHFKKSMLGGVASFFSYTIAIYAMTQAPIAMVAALRETSVLFGLLLAVYFLNERLTFVHSLAILFVAFGAILLKLA